MARAASPAGGSLVTRSFRPLAMRSSRSHRRRVICRRRACARTRPFHSSNITDAVVEDDALDLRPGPSSDARDAEREQVACLDPVGAHDEPAHLGPNDRPRWRRRPR